MCSGQTSIIAGGMRVGTTVPEGRYKDSPWRESGELSYDKHQPRTGRQKSRTRFRSRLVKISPIMSTMKTIPEGFACVAPIYKDATPKKLSAVSFQPDMAVSIFKDATKFEKVKFRERVFRGEWVVRCGCGGGWGFGRFFIFYRRGRLRTRAG